MERHVIKDSTGGVTFVVLAYRKLSREEVVQAIQVWRSTRKRRPKSGSVVTITTTHGFNQA